MKQKKEIAIRDHSLDSQEWYRALIEEADAIITESGEASRWALVEGYHQLGMRILEDTKNFERADIYGDKIVQHVAQSLGKSLRTIQYAVQFADKFPKLDNVPGGKAITWHKVCNVILVGKSVDKDCNHGNGTVVIEICVDCHKRIRDEEDK